MKRSTAHFWIGTTALFAGVSNILFEMQDPSKNLHTFFIIASVIMMLIGMRYLDDSVRSKYQTMRSYEEQLNDILDKPLPKRWKQ